MQYSKTIFIIIIILLGTASLHAQETRLTPEWWFGAAAGANFNFHSTEINKLNNDPALFSAPLSSPFASASGVGLFAAPLLEYRPDKVWGGMVTLGFDARGGDFDDVNDTAGFAHKLSTSMNYLSLEPSLRVTPFEVPFYIFAGPRLGFNVAKSFEHESQGVKKSGDFSGARGTVITGQIGVGYDIPLNSRNSTWLTDLSPFVSFHFGQGPRSEESWTLTTIRVGAALKFGSTTSLVTNAEKQVSFSVQAPQLIPTERRVKESFPLRNYVFFDINSTAIPSRYIRLSKDDAKGFKEESLVEPQPKDLSGRSRRQQTVYYNILNVLGDRMRRNPSTNVKLVGASLNGPKDGETLAEAVQRYLVDVFDINPIRITISGVTKPSVPSYQSGGSREVDLVQAEDRRVDITSTSPELMMPVQIVSLQDDPFDSDLIFNVGGAQDALASWSLEATDTKGNTKTYGPYTAEQERISGKTILAGQSDGQFNIVMIGQTKGGQTIRKEKTVRLALADKPEEDLGLRFSILFEFDQSRTVTTYERFLTETVAPLVPDGASVIIHGHTDIVGEESHNLQLSRGRAAETMNTLQRALEKAGKKRIKFDTYGFGEDQRRAPFDNNLPEQRFYNRTVIIDIVPEG